MVLFGAGYALDEFFAAVVFASLAEEPTAGDRLGQSPVGPRSSLPSGRIRVPHRLHLPDGSRRNPGLGSVHAFSARSDLVSCVLVLTQPGPLQIFPTVRKPVQLRAGPPRRSADRADPRRWWRCSSRQPRDLARVDALPDGRPRRAPADSSGSSSPGSVGDRSASRRRRSVVMDGAGRRRERLAGVRVRGRRSSRSPSAIAILRHNLYDIDRIVSRTIAYALVSAIVAVVFGAVVVLLSTALSSFAQGQTIAVAASTLAAFAVFQPVLRRVRREVDMRFNRARYDADQTVAEFSARLRNEVDIATVARDWTRPSRRREARVAAAVAPRGETVTTHTEALVVAVVWAITAVGAVFMTALAVTHHRGRCVGPLVGHLHGPERSRRGLCLGRRDPRTPAARERRRRRLAGVRAAPRDDVLRVPARRLVHRSQRPRRPPRHGRLRGRQRDRLPDGRSSSGRHLRSSFQMDACRDAAGGGLSRRSGSS